MHTNSLETDCQDQDDVLGQISGQENSMALQKLKQPAKNSGQLLVAVEGVTSTTIIVSADTTSATDEPVRKPLGGCGITAGDGDDGAGDDGAGDDGAGDDGAGDDGAGDDGEPGEVVLPFELDVQDSRDLLSLTEEMEHILDPKNTLRTPPPMVDLPPLECHALQLEEVETLIAIYGSDMKSLNDRGTCFLINVRFLSEEIKEEDVIKIWFSLPASYPCVPPVFEIEANRSGSFTYNDADDLFDLLMRESINRVGDMMIFDLVTIAQDYMPDLVERKRVSAEKRAVEERERQKTMELEEAFRDNAKTRGLPREMWDVLLEEQSSHKDRSEEGESGEGGGEEGEATGHTHSHPAKPKGKKSGEFFKPAQFVGSISDILKGFPDGLQILRIENILRQDLAGRFRRCQYDMQTELTEKERKYPQMFDLKTQVAFHGTLTKSLPSIVQQGLIIPGAENRVKVRCGSSLGVGIYLSPSAEFSLSYTDSSRLIVCAALLGRVYNYSSNSWKGTTQHHSRYHAVVCGEEWVFFNAAQVLPCYVILVQQGAKKGGKQSNPPPLSSLLDSSHHSSTHREEETGEQRKARLAARARKFLPYGFGPGSKTVILDVASVDDDEEDYGDYQLLRYTSSMADTDLHTSGVVQETSELQGFRFTSPSTDTTHCS